MQKSQRLGAIILAVSIFVTVHGTVPANGQAAQHAQPLFQVQGAAHANATGYTPDQIRHGYGFENVVNQGKGQIIAIVDAFDDPNIEDDLRVFDKQFNLPACTTANGCFQKVFDGSKPGQDLSGIWPLETALDVEWAHAIAPKAKILLVEAHADHLSDLLAAVHFALTFNPGTVSMSWGTAESLFSGALEETTDDLLFNSSYVTFFAAAGDSGNGTCGFDVNGNPIPGICYPAASPYVMGVGGTTLRLDTAGNYLSERAFSSGGGGQSAVEQEPSYQSAYPIPNEPRLFPKRGVPDVAYIANPGVAMYTSFTIPGTGQGWFEVGGTSVGPPQWAALVAIANSMRDPKKLPLTGKHGVLYDAAKELNDDFNDITKGRNGTCGALCKAKPNYDYATGLGTPEADNLIPDLRDLP
jgi:subtilase family serine protease